MLILSPKDDLSIQNTDQDSITMIISGNMTKRKMKKEPRSSVFIFKDGEKSFEWIQEPELLNFGGAIGRLPVEKVVQKAAEIS